MSKVGQRWGDIRGDKQGQGAVGRHIGRWAGSGSGKEAYGDMWAGSGSGGETYKDMGRVRERWRDIRGDGQDQAVVGRHKGP